MIQKIFKHSKKMITVIALLVAWEITSSLILPKFGAYYSTIFPPLSKIITAAVELASRGLLLEHALSSLKRVFVGVTAAICLAVPIGLLKAWYSSINDQIDPVLEFLRPIPPIAWIPLSIIWFGIGDTQGEFIIFLAVFFPVLINTVAGARSISRNVLRVAENVEASGFFLFRKVILAGALPNIFVGIRIGFGIGWMASVGAEMVGARSGLGFLINQARQFLRTDWVIVGMVTIGIIGVVIGRALFWLERKVLPWADHQK